RRMPAWTAPWGAAGACDWPSSKPSKKSRQDSSTDAGSARQRWYCASIRSRFQRVAKVARVISNGSCRECPEAVATPLYEGMDSPAYGGRARELGARTGGVSHAADDRVFSASSVVGQ